MVGARSEAHSRTTTTEEKGVVLMPHPTCQHGSPVPSPLSMTTAPTTATEPAPLPLEQPARVRAWVPPGPNGGTHAQPHDPSPAAPRSRRRLVVYAAFDSPWSYLASRRATVLEAVGVHVDWRAVVEEAAPSTAASARAERLDRVHAELERTLAVLLPEETLPSSLAGFVPGTAAAVTAYADAYQRGASRQARRALFDALWLHGFDLADPRETHTLMEDVLSAFRQSHRPGRRADARPARRLQRQWEAQRRATRATALPVLVRDRGPALEGPQVADWLARATAWVQRSTAARSPESKRQTP